MWNEDMISPNHFTVLRKIHARLSGSGIHWLVTGSLGAALQGVPFEVHDIDIQTDAAGAYEIERRFAECVTNKVAFSTYQNMRSHFGALAIDGIKVEIMGDIQLQRDDGTWEDPVDLNRYRVSVEVEGMPIPVVSLERESYAYSKLGRIEKAVLLGQWLQDHPRSNLDG